MLAKFKALWKDEEAATAVEYGLIVAFVALGIVLAAKALGGSISTFLGNVGTAVEAQKP
jgi:pilus assembly protein Flp/PilA